MIAVFQQPTVVSASSPHMRTQQSHQEGLDAWFSRQDDSTFTFAVVPEGDYVLRADGVDNDYFEVANAHDSWPATHTESKLLHSYGTAESQLHVTGELIGISISAPDPASSHP